MTGKLKKTLSILNGEFRLQLVVFCAVVAFFLLSMSCIKFFRFDERLLPVMFILIYMLIISFVLPWQTNLKGGISPGYCRYYLSLPVKTWQLYFWPLLSRLLLIVLFAAIVYVSYRLFFGYENEYYFYPRRIWNYTKISLMVYLVLQAFAWTKDSFKNLHIYFIAVFIICAFACPGIISGAFNDMYFPAVAIVLIVASFWGVRNLRKGIVRYLPLLPGVISRVSCYKVVSYRSATTAQFYQEWKRTWFFMPVIYLGFIILMMTLMIRSTGIHSKYIMSRDLTLMFHFFLSFVLLCGAYRPKPRIKLTITAMI